MATRRSTGTATGRTRGVGRDGDGDVTSHVEDLTRLTRTWVEEQGVVLQSARGPIPNVAEFIAGEPIRGSWWGHAAGKMIYEILNVLDDDKDIVTTRLVNAKITLLHARVWPAIVRVSARLGTQRLSAIHQEHTESGAHRNHEELYPRWVPADAITAATKLSETEAFGLLPACLRYDGEPKSR
ncbi:MAG TPA: hypothetical protein VIJ99_03770 [Acidimicrobiales bacterium]